MGLDSHLSGRRAYWGDDRMVDHEGYYIEAVEVYLGYWRKDYGLQEYVTEHFGDGNDGSGPIDLTLENLHQILEAVPSIDVSGTWRGDEYEESPEDKAARIEDTKAMIAKAIAFLTIDTVLPPPKLLWRTVFWHASW
jgi:hypothetical protein